MTWSKTFQSIAGQRGETFVESLVSVLLATIATVMLATAIASTTRIIMSSKETMDNYYEGGAALAQRSASNGTISLNVSGGGFSCTISDLEEYEYTIGGKTVVAYGM